MKRIISASRRTDIPAFYGKWFMGRLKEGFAGVVHPFGERRYIVSLKPQDVTCFVFWSKNFGPFLDNLKTIEDMGYRFYFNYTVTCLPEEFESDIDREQAISALKKLSKMYSPAHINWRFDPIVISSICDPDFFIKGFESLASQFEGVVERCYISFVTEYGKVKRNFSRLFKEKGVRVTDPGGNFKVELAEELADIAARYGIEMFSCCGEYLVNDKIKKAHCIDGAVIQRLFYPEGFEYRKKPTRPQCGCTESTDIGTYDTCAHGCVYCYANSDKSRAFETAARHEANSAFLGYSKSQSDRWLAKINDNRKEKDSKQFTIWGQ